MEQNQSTRIKGFKNPETLTSWVRYFLVIQVILTIATVISNAMEYQFLDDLENGFYLTDEAALSDAEASDLRQSTVAVALLASLFVGGIIILVWIHRANYNLRQIGVKNMNFTPGWSVGWYFVPIANLWKPFQSMKEIWNVSHSFSGAVPSNILNLWWALWIGSYSLTQYVTKKIDQAEEIHEMKDANLLSSGHDLIWIPLCFVFLKMVNVIHSAQMKKFNEGQQSP